MFRFTPAHPTKAQMCVLLSHRRLILITFCYICVLGGWVGVRASLKSEQVQSDACATAHTLLVQFVAREALGDALGELKTALD